MTTEIIPHAFTVADLMAMQRSRYRPANSKCHLKGIEAG